MTPHLSSFKRHVYVLFGEKRRTLNIPGLIQTLKYYNPVFSKISSVWILDKLRGWTWNNYISALLHATWYIHVLHFHKQHPGVSVARKITLSDWRKICATRRLNHSASQACFVRVPGKYEFPFSSKLCIQPFSFLERYRELFMTRNLERRIPSHPTLSHIDKCPA